MRRYPIRAGLTAVLAAGIFGLGGCASIPDRVAALPAAQPSVEITATPFYPQERYQCGPAALTTLLTFSGVDAALDTITDLTYIPGRKGSLQTEMLGTARSFERIPYRIEGTMSVLAAELAAGRPVLVLQNLGVGWHERWHYAVVIGIDVASGDVVLRSGTDRRRVTHANVFLRTWQRSGYWAFVLLRPGELPAEPDRDNYFTAIADFETVGEPQAVWQAWEAALRHWPNDPVALFGKANVAFGQERYEAAEQSYRLLLADHPEMHAARNNLAYALAKQGDVNEALAELHELLGRVAVDDPLRVEYEASLHELESLEKTGQ